MITIHLENELIKEIDIQAKSQHTNRSTIIRAALIRYLEDNEDLQLAIKAKNNMKSSKKLSQLRKELDLDD